MKPMLAKCGLWTDLPAQLQDDNWWAQQKLDGDRVLIAVDDGVVTALNRSGEVRRNSVPRKVLDQFRGLPGRWRFDGELLLDALWLFDLPEAMGHVKPEHPFDYRVEVLAGVFSTWNPASCVRLLPTARLQEDKARLLNAVHAQGAEGFIMKHRAAPYRPGKRSHMMVKYKLTNTADVVVMQLAVEGRQNCAYGLFDNGQLVDVGSCSLMGKPAVSVGDVIEVRYLYASEDRKLYQPTMVRVRDDKPAEQCTIDQLSFTNREVIEFTPTVVGPFLRQQRRARATGTTVSVYDGHHPDSAFSRDDYRWITFCEAHELLCAHETLADARNFAVTPHIWCEGCSQIWKERQS